MPKSKKEQSEFMAKYNITTAIRSGNIDNLKISLKKAEKHNVSLASFSKQELTDYATIYPDSLEMLQELIKMGLEAAPQALLVQLRDEIADRDLGNEPIQRHLKFFLYLLTQPSVDWHSIEGGEPNEVIDVNEPIFLEYLGNPENLPEIVEILKEIDNHVPLSPSWEPLLTLLRSAGLDVRTLIYDVLFTRDDIFWEPGKLIALLRSIGIDENQLFRELIIARKIERGERTPLAAMRLNKFRKLHLNEKPNSGRPTKRRKLEDNGEEWSRAKRKGGRRRKTMRRRNRDI